MSKVVKVLPGGFSGLVSKLAQAKVAARPVKAPRKTLLTDARAAVARDELPALLEFSSVANDGYNRHTKALRELALAGDLAALREYHLGGSNTYARAVRGYRELLVSYAERKAIRETLQKAQKQATVGTAKAKQSKVKMLPKVASKKAKASKAKA